PRSPGPAGPRPGRGRPPDELSTRPRQPATEKATAMKPHALIWLAVVAAVAAPARAQPTRNYSEDARLTYLRQADLCLLHVGAFMELTTDKYAPSEADRDLMGQLGALAD